MTTLSPEKIQELIASKRDRGGYPRFAETWATSGEMYCLLNEHPQFAAKIKAGHGDSVKQGLTAAFKKVDGRYKILVEEDELILVNLDLHEAAYAEVIAEEK